jgi:beta-mannosidase
LYLIVTVGWDWGPAYIPAGISGSISLVVGSTGRLDGLVVKQTDFVVNSATSADAVLNLFVKVAACTSAYKATANVYLDGTLVQTKEDVEIPVSLNPLNNAIMSQYLKEIHQQYHGSSNQMVVLDPQLVSVGSISMRDAKLWWPRGHGDQHLYSVKVELIPLTREQSTLRRGLATTESSVQSIQRKIGVRSIQLIQEEYSSVDKNSFGSSSGDAGRSQSSASKQASLPSPVPASYYFRINNEPIFMRGANFIPLDSFQSRVHKHDRLYLLHTAMEANYNMLRVWGGGYYQPDDLYDFADEMGILMWQEVMLAVR